MQTTPRRVTPTVVAAALVLAAVGLEPAEARRQKTIRVGSPAGPVVDVTVSQTGTGYPYAGYSSGYQGYPYGPGHPYWDGRRYVYGPDYGGPILVPPGGYRR